MVLTALRLHQNSVHMAAIEQADPATLCVLSTFSTLTTLFLRAPNSEDISLHALAGLPSLHALRLDLGNFSDVDAAAHLTNLVLMDHVEASCSEDCSCVTSLLKLRLGCSQLRRFHSQGVSACSNLQSLSCSDSLVSAVNPNEDFQWDDTRISTGPSLTALTALSSLSLRVITTDASLKLEWVTMLKSLQQLHAFLDSAELPAAFSSMRNLTSLMVGSYCNPDAVVKLMFDWSELVSLRYVFFNGPVRVSKLDDLITLPTLQQFHYVMPSSDSVPNNQLLELVYRLGRERPDVAAHLPRP